MINDAEINDKISPFLRAEYTSQSIMIDVIIALIPALLGSIYFYGFQSLTIILVSVITCVASEFIWQKLAKRPLTINDYSAIVTGLLLAYNMPVTSPIWIVVVASAFSIIVAKQIFGGIGGNFANPALMGRALIMFAWPSFIAQYITTNHAGVDAVASATVLSMVKGGQEVLDFSKWDMFIGNVPGSLGETSSLLLLIGFVYLWYRKVVDPKVTISYILTVLVITFVFGPQGLFTGDIITNLLGGGLILGACYMMTDYSSVSSRVRITLAIIAGLITGGIRVWGLYPEGVYFGILLSNCLGGIVEKIFKPHIYGMEKKSKKAVNN